MRQLIMHQFPKLIVTENAIPRLVCVCCQRIEREALKRAADYDVIASLIAKNVIETRFEFIANRPALDVNPVRIVDAMCHRIRGIFSLGQYPELLNVLRQEAVRDIGELGLPQVTNQTDALALKLRTFARNWG